MSDKKMTIEINYDDYPELYSQLEKIMNNEIIKGKVKLNSDNFITSEHQYLESLVKLDKVINGFHPKDTTGFYSSRNPDKIYSLYYDSRCIEKYCEVPIGYLITEMNEYIDSVYELIKNMYDKLPLDLINSYLEIEKENKISRYSMNDFSHMDGIFAISKGDNLSLITYYLNLIKRIKDELESRNKHDKIKDLPDIKIDDEFRSICESLYSLYGIKEIPANFGEDFVENFLKGNMPDYIDEIMMYVNLCLGLSDKDWFNQHAPINVWLNTLQWKSAIPAEEPFTEILYDLSNKIAKMFINQYISNLVCLNPYHFNYYVKFIYDNYHEEDKTNILEKCKDITPYANKLYLLCTNYSN